MNIVLQLDGKLSRKLRKLFFGLCNQLGLCNFWLTRNFEFMYMLSAWSSLHHNSWGIQKVLQVFNLDIFISPGSVWSNIIHANIIQESIEKANKRDGLNPLIYMIYINWGLQFVYRFLLYIYKMKRHHWRGVYRFP